MKKNNSYLRFPNGLSKALTLSYDDAVIQDVRLIDIMKQNGLKGTFNINSAQYITKDFVYPADTKWGQRMTEEEATALYGQDGIEPALHAHTHADLALLPTAQAAYEVIKNREAMEAQFGRIVRGMAYPFGTFCEETANVLRTCGVAYCRTVHSTETFQIPTDWLHLNPTCHHANPRLNELTEKFIQKKHAAKEKPYLFYLWGHAFEFERDQNWNIIEDFAKKTGNRDDIWYATNIEIYEYVESYRNLIFSLDQRHVQNPSAYDVWFTYGENLYCVKAGETVSLPNII